MIDEVTMISKSLKTKLKIAYYKFLDKLYTLIRILLRRNDAEYVYACQMCYKPMFSVGSACDVKCKHLNNLKVSLYEADTALLGIVQELCMEKIENSEAYVFTMPDSAALKAAINYLYKFGLVKMEEPPSKLEH